MTTSTVRVRGLRELQRDLKRMEGDVGKEVKDGLREAGRIVADDATRRFSGISPRSAAGFRPVVRARGVAVEQKYRRTTGKHPRFGSLQMGIALIPALEAKASEVVDEVDKVLGRLAGDNGF